MREQNNRVQELVNIILGTMDLEDLDISHYEDFSKNVVKLAVLIAEEENRACK